MEKAIEKYRKLSPLNKFIFKGAFLYALWRLFQQYTFVHEMNGAFVKGLGRFYVSGAHFLLSILGYTPEVNYSHNCMRLPGGEGVMVEFGCMGFGLLAFFLIFAIAYPMSYKQRSGLIVIGIFIIFTVNTLRIAALAWIDRYFSENFDLFHNYIFPSLFYMILFTVCIIGVNWGKNSKVDKKDF